MRRVRSIGTAAALAAALVLVPGSATAGVRVVAPEHLQVEDRESEAFEVSAWRATSDDTTPARFWAPVKLPVGTRIRGMTFYSWGSAASPRYARLYRVRTGEPAELLMALTTSEDRPASQAPVALVATPSIAPAGAYLVRRGYRYYIEAYVSNWNASIQGVAVTYR